jgi:hypothetical protein
MSIWLAFEPGTQTVVVDDDEAPLQPLNVKPVSAGAVRRADWPASTPDGIPRPVMTVPTVPDPVLFGLPEHEVLPLNFSQLILAFVGPPATRARTFPSVKLDVAIPDVAPVAVTL